MNKRKSLYRFTAGAALLIGILRSPLLSSGPATTPTTVLQLQATGAQPAATATATAESASYKNYTYYADRFRDPFIPLTGEFRSDQSLDHPPQIASLMLKGIVQDTRGRMALLTSGVNSYILKGGRLYDGRNRMIKKIAGVIKTESVVLIGADRTVREIRTKSLL
jgi:hypothetical protein